jgi:hypothetical protein
MSEIKSMELSFATTLIDYSYIFHALDYVLRYANSLIHKQKWIECEVHILAIFRN